MRVWVRVLLLLGRTTSLNRRLQFLTASIRSHEAATAHSCGVSNQVRIDARLLLLLLLLVAAEILRRRPAHGRLRRGCRHHRSC